MDFSKLKKEVKGVTFAEIRIDLDNHFEAVVLNNNLLPLVPKLEEFLGKAVFPSGSVLSMQIQNTIKGFGGISEGQTLYFLSEDKSVIFAMLWPWADKVHTTLKLVCIS